MKEIYYILKDKIAVPVPDVLAWARWFEFALAKRRVAETVIGPIVISTVFLGLDHAFGHGPPLIFETMIFRGGDGDETWRFSSWQEAEEGHARAVNLVRGEILQKVQE